MSKKKPISYKIVLVSFFLGCPLGTWLTVASGNPRFYENSQGLAGVIVLALLTLLIFTNCFLEVRQSGLRSAYVLAHLMFGIPPLLLLIGIGNQALKYSAACNQIASNAVLEYCDFSNQDLSNSNLSGADLENAQLSEANLQNANLSETNLTGAQLSGTNLQQANLVGSVLAGADLNRSNLQMADLTRAVLAGADLSGSNLQMADLTGAVLSGANLSNADLTGAILDKAVIENIILQDAIGITDSQLANALAVSIDNLPATLSKKNIRLESRESILNGIKDVCQGTGVEEASNYTSSDSFHPVLLWDNIDTDSLYSNFVNQTWEPMALRFLELVVCPGEVKKVSIETCTYNVVGEASIERFDVERFLIRQYVRLVAAKTGGDVAEQFVSGTPPDRCPETASAAQQDQIGARVLFEDVERWLVEFVNPP